MKEKASSATPSTRPPSTDDFPRPVTSLEEVAAVRSEMERSPASGPSGPGGSEGAGEGAGAGAGASMAPGQAASASKPSLSQQILRTFRPRASVTAAPFVSSATASPMVRAVDSSAPNTPGLGPSSVGRVMSVGEAAIPHGMNGTLTGQDSKAVASLTLTDYVSLLQDLRKPIPQGTTQERDVAIQHAMQCIRTLLTAIKSATEVEEKTAEGEDVDWSTDQMTQAGPPQAEVFKVCLFLLTQAREGLLPLPLCLGVCELVTASVHLSDVRASKATKAARETRSGAPGSQSSKALDADRPLANIDRAALYALVCQLSDHVRGPAPAKDNNYDTRLPALPMQLKAIDCLSLEGRDVASLPGILEFLGHALEVVWQEMQTLRRMTNKEIVEGSTENASIEEREEQTMILEQLTLREWSVLSCLQLITSIIKYSFSKLDMASVEDVLLRVSGMLQIHDPVLAVGHSPHHRGSAKKDSRRARSKSKERRPLTDGYDYYGLDTLNQSDTPSPSATPRGAMTPKVGPRPGAESTSVAPIALATVPPISSLEASAVPLPPSTYMQTILQESEVRAALKLLDSVLRFGFMPPNSVESVTRMLCCILGHNVVTPNAETDWSTLARPVLANLLRSHCANASLRCARRTLVDTHDEEDITVLCGAVEFIKAALSLAAETEQQQSVSSSAVKGHTEDALAPSLSVPLLMPALTGALQRHVDVLDIQVLDLVSEMLPLKDGRHLLGQRLTPDDWDMLLDLPGIAKRHLQEFNVKFGRNAIRPSGQQAASTPAVIAAMLNLVGRLRLAHVQETEEGKEDELPWTPKLANLLLSLAPFLSDPIVVDLVEYYKARHLCLPCTPEWIANVRSLLNALFHRHVSIGIHTASSMGDTQRQQQGRLARTTLVTFLFEHVYETVQDLSKHRSTLLLQVVLPLAQSALAAEGDTFVESTIRKALVNAAVTAIGTTGAGAQDDDGEDGVPTAGDAIFNEIVELHCKLARSSSSGANGEDKQSKEGSTGNASHQHVSFADPPGSHDHKPGSRTHSRNSSLVTGMAMVGSGKPIDNVPAQHSKATRSTQDLISIFHRLAFSSPWVLLPTSRSNIRSEKAQRLAWEKRARSACLTIFRALLDLVKPAKTEVANDTTSQPGDPNTAAAIPPASTAVRLAILQWLVRLRTDGEHRIYIAGDLHDLIVPAATTLHRGPASAVDADSATAEQQNSNATPFATTGQLDRSRSRRDTVAGRDGGGRDLNRNRTAAERSTSRIRDASRERGRRDQANETVDTATRLRSPSRSRSAATTATPAPARRAPVEPLWRLPETLLFEVPQSGWRSDVVFTYMHPASDGSAHHHHQHRHASVEEGVEPPVPMPISDYVATCISILSRDNEWELISYILCHLPVQLANKHLVCGPKAQKQVMVLRQMLATSVLEQKFINQVALPDDVKKSDVYAVAYGTLATLISYRALFSRTQQDELVEAFMAGLNKSSNTAQPCIRALTVACYELQKSINRHLPKMLVKLSTVMSSSTMSVHILEMIAAIGHLPSLYANFTETDYRRIFGIALQYIQYHNQRSVEEDTRSSATVFTLSQYVIMLAYYNISLWFMIVKLSDRPKYVESVRKGLLLANEGRTKVADQTEVCFDFLARYTHSNAEPRPQRSFLNQIVNAKGRGVQNSGASFSAGRNGPTAKHFLYGKGLLTVSSLDKNGWAEVLVRKPSGTVGLLCKLENVPISQLPEEDQEKVDLPAAIMMDRKPLTTSRSSQGHTSLAAWAREQLQERQMQSSVDRPLRPAPSRLARRPRSASFTLDERKVQTKITFAKKDADAYAKNEGVMNEDGVLLPESEELKDIMRRVLSESASDVEATGQDVSAVTGSSSAQGATAGLGQTQSASTKQRAGATRNEHAVDPGFLALQLSSYPDTAPSSRPPVLLPNEAWVQRMVRAVDLTPTVDFHRIGILYVGTGQTNEREILGNRTGSTRYAHFLRGMGDLITLHGQQNVYTGGLDTQNNEHGKYAYVWGDDISQIVFHTTTLMPNDEVHDPSHARKKALIGNDWVRVVWNESGREYDFDTIKTQFNFINLIVSPNSRGGGELGSIGAADSLFYRVSLQCIDGLPDFAPVGDGQLVSAAALPNFVRILALNCSLVSQIYVATRDREPGQPFTYLSNWVTRLHHIERARNKIESDTAKATGISNEAGADKPAANGDNAGNGQATEAGDGASKPAKVISASDATSYDILRF